MKARSTAVVATNDGVRLTVRSVKGRPMVIEFDSTEAQAAGRCLYLTGRVMGNPRMLEDMETERDALNDCIAALGGHACDCR